MTDQGISTSDKALEQYLLTSPVRFITSLRHAVTATPYNHHHHAGMEIVYHPTGSGTTSTAENGTLAYGAGSVVVYAPGQEHDQQTRQAGFDWCIQIELPPPLPTGLRGCWSLDAVHDPYLLNELDLLSRTRADDQGLARTSRDLRARTLLLLLVHARSAAQQPLGVAERLAERTRQWIREHGHEVAGVEQIAAAMGVGVDHLRHAFKARHGQSVVSWLSETRVARAKELLAHTSLPLKEISASCAFSSEQYFCAAFRRQTGTSPGAFREHARN